MNENDKIARAAEDYNNFITLRSKGDKSAAYNLLKKIDLHLVKKHYKDDFKVNPEHEAQFNEVSEMAKCLEIGKFRLNKLAKLKGHGINKSRSRPSVNNCCGYMFFDLYNIESEVRLDATLDEIEELLRNE